MGEGQRELAALEITSASPDFWKDQERARRVSEKAARIRQDLALWGNLEKRAYDLLELVKAAESEPGDEGLLPEFQREYSALDEEFRKAEFAVFLSGPYDRGDAILNISAGVGGRDAEDWAGMLRRMYERYLERKGYRAEVLGESLGEEGGLKSAEFIVRGPCAYGYLRGEKGVHRLVRISPFNAQGLRQTSFAAVDVFPMLEETDQAELKPDEISIDLFRSSGPGGQNVNKRETAVRIRHKPTGITAACQTERSQSANRERALQILKAKLADFRRSQKENEAAKIHGETVRAVWSRQIRSYVLHPYKMVKDLRTGVEVSDPARVLDGDLDLFINAQLRQLPASGT